jgi:hypothetical protein
VPEIIDPVFAKTRQNARFLLSENERFGLVFVKTGSINSGTDVGQVVRTVSQIFFCHCKLTRSREQHKDVLTSSQRMTPFYHVGYLCLAIMHKCRLYTIGSKFSLQWIEPIIKGIKLGSIIRHAAICNMHSMLIMKFGCIHAHNFFSSYV